jgi:hypothetical protein
MGCRQTHPPPPGESLLPLHLCTNAMRRSCLEAAVAASAVALWQRQQVHLLCACRLMLPSYCRGWCRPAGGRGDDPAALRQRLDKAERAVEKERRAVQVSSILQLVACGCRLDRPAPVALFVAWQACAAAPGV